MKSKKHALVLFTKHPEPGVTKTRLMLDNGGDLTGQEASDFYRAMVLDTAAAAFRALEHCRKRKFFGDDYDFLISSSPANDIPKIQEMFEAEFPEEHINYIVDEGQNFDEHFNDCYRQIFQMGYHQVVCIGGDLPSITPGIIVRSFEHLSRLGKSSDTGAMVLAPCQEGGVSLVGITRDTPMDFTGVFYNTGGVTALDAIIDIAERNSIPAALLEAISDVDYMQDLGHMITVVNAMAYTAKFQPEIAIPERTIAFIREVGLIAYTPPNESYDPREAIDG